MAENSFIIFLLPDSCPLINIFPEIIHSPTAGLYLAMRMNAISGMSNMFFRFFITLPLQRVIYRKVDFVYEVGGFAELF